jgi:hypothetical protein
MKKLGLILGLVMMSAFTFAQQGQRPERPQPPSMEERIAKAKTDLSLTDEQVVKWEEIHAKYEPSMKDKANAETARKQMTEELKATLTEEQLTKFKDQPKARPSRR